MHPRFHAQQTPDRPAYIIASTGETVTYAELEARANQGAQVFRALGLSTGDVVAILMENNARFFEIAWAAQRAGLYFTCISTKLTARDVAYIVGDSGAKLVVTSADLDDLARELAGLIQGPFLYMANGASARYKDVPPPHPYEHFDAARAKMSTAPIADETAGVDMLYSSGTTGRPKGVKPALPGAAIDTPDALLLMVKTLFGFPDGCIYLSPAPLYHAAPLRWSMRVHKLGGTVIVMDRFDAETVLALIEKYRVDCAQFVPTHFVRLLKLPAEVHRRYDVSSLRSVVHAAAPCPVAVKEAMMAWWGPIIHEYYAGTEGNGLCYISPGEWLARKGSVGRAMVGELRICDEAGEPLPARTEGVIYFANGPPVAYHNDPAKTAECTNKHGWTTLGDVGWMDEDGYLHLTDRKSFMIISGGVNIYPQEIENLLVTHPKVTDVAVIGAPDDEMGEKVVAVVQPAEWSEAGPALASELIAFVRANLSHVKAPRVVDFLPELPRHPTGKLYKRLLRDSYWGRQTTIV